MPRRTHSPEYRLYLHSAAWQVRRWRSLALAGYKCERCQRPYGLQVHHLTYARLGREWDGDLRVLCRWCHAQEHDAGRGPQPKNAA